MVIFWKRSLRYDRINFINFILNKIYAYRSEKRPEEIATKISQYKSAKGKVLQNLVETKSDSARKKARELRNKWLVRKKKQA